MVGVIDEPLSGSAQDALGINQHATALIKFIDKADTPITLGIQGEWGSGKTSLLNTIREALSTKSEIKQIWINAWENSLLSSPEEALLKIINEIIDELVAADTDKERKEKILASASTVFKGALRIGAHAALGSKGSEIAEEILSTKTNSIKQLRSDLTSLIDEIRLRKTNKYTKIVIYVDDLDRVDPKDAVSVLELLKNIFSLPGCVFVLAIDYQVVVKGLEHKFGKQTADNEWEFRAFFDKIIQLPFMMPMSQYNIGKYVKNMLSDIDFSSSEQLDEEIITRAIMHSIGGNPRSLKRLVNSVALIEIFRSENIDPAVELRQIEARYISLLLFCLVCMQIAYPDIYSLLSRHPNFITWDENLAFAETQGKEAEVESFERDFETAQSTSEFDEEWEKALYRICYVKPRYRAKSSNISKFISILKDDILFNHENDIEEIVGTILQETSVTSVTSTNEVQREKKAYSPHFFEGQEAWAKEKENEGTDSTFIKLALDMVNVFSDSTSEQMEIKYSPSSGATFYYEGGKFSQINVKGKKKSYIVFFSLKDPELGFRLKPIGDLTTNHSRKLTRNSAFSCHNAHYYACKVYSVDDYINNKEDFISNFKRGLKIHMEGTAFEYRKYRVLAFDKGDDAAMRELEKILDPEYRVSS